jgi:hypothetical protein
MLEMAAIEGSKLQEIARLAGYGTEFIAEVSENRASYVGSRRRLDLATISSSCRRHTRRHPHHTTNGNAQHRPFVARASSEKSTPHAKLPGLRKFTITTDRTIRTDSSNQPRCLPKSPISSSSSRSAGARMLSVRFTISPCNGN